MVHLRFLVWLIALIGPPTARGGESPPEAAGPNPVPGPWTLLDADLRLWHEPDGQRFNEPLRAAKAGDQVWVLAHGKAGPGSTLWLKIKAGEQTGWLPEALLAPRPLGAGSKPGAEIGRERVDRRHGLDPRYAPPDLVPITRGYHDEVAYRLRREAASAYERMILAAHGDSIDLQVVSAYRSYETQRSIYLRKLERAGWNQKTVAKPGHSEHQLGTTVDLTDGQEATLLRAEFAGTRAGRWLTEHAPDFGFAVSYTQANADRTGYAAEPWHYRYWGVNQARTRHQDALRGKRP